MSVDVRAMLMAKKVEKDKQGGSGLVMKDINRDLITALLAISVYGKEARDEEILSVIINAGRSYNPLYNKLCEDYADRVKKWKITQDEKGDLRDKDGFLVLAPTM